MERVLIFGATSAIAADVASLYAARGARLHLVGRSREKLSALEARCRAIPGVAGVSSKQADLDDLDANASLVDEGVRSLGGVDVALIAHGDLGDQLESERSFRAAEATLRTNLSSPISLLIPLANHMEAARSGRLAVLGSVAGERGRPRNYTYGTAKGALRTYLQGLRSRLYPSGVSVTTIKLGPVDSPMTRDHAKHALFGEVGAVARGVVRAIDARASEAYVPSFWAVLMPIVRATPEALFQRVGVLSDR